MPDQPNDHPTQPVPDDQTTVIDSPDAEPGPAPTATGESAADEPSWAKKPLQLTRAVATGAAAGILLVGGVSGLAIGAILAGDDSHGDAPGRTDWHTERGDRGGLPEGGQGDWREQGPPQGFGPDGRDGDSPTPVNPSDSST